MPQSIIEESKRSRRGLSGFLIRKKWLALAIVLILAGGLYYYLQSGSEKKETANVAIKKYTAKTEDLRIAVSATGKVVAEDGVELSFPISGSLEVQSVYVKEGDRIKKGDKIASVKTESLEFELRSAYNSYQSALASYNSKLETASESEIAKAKASIEQAQLALTSAQLSYNQTLYDSEQNIKNAEATVKTAENNLKLNSSLNDSEIVHNAYVSLINTLKSISLSLSKQLQDSDAIIGVDDEDINDEFERVLGALDSASYGQAKSSYLQAKNARSALDEATESLNDYSSHAAVEAAARQAAVAISAMQEHQRYLKKLLDTTITFTGLSQSKLDSFKATVNSNQSGALALSSSLNSAQQAVDNAESSLAQYETNYDKAVRDLESVKKSAEQSALNASSSIRTKEIALAQAKSDYQDLIEPLSANDLAAARAQLTSAAIAVDRTKYNMEQATLTSPIDGVIAALNYKEGDIILDGSSADSVATIINNETLYVEVNVEEADISKLKVGDKAEVGFDAVEGVNLEGEISFISLTSSSNSNGIVTYLVRVILNKEGHDQIREGMTASLEFVTAEAPQVVAVPVAAVRNVNGSPSVEIVDGSIRPVVTGFTDGKKVEIVSGLVAGESIIY